MEPLKILLKACNFCLPITDYVYILQQEEYDLKRYVFWAKKFFLRRNIQARDALHYTLRAQLIVGLTLFILATIASLSFAFFPFPTALIIVTLSSLITYFWVGLSTLVLEPVFLLLHRYYIFKAGRVVSQSKQLQIIAVAGSYGKTTVKNFIFQLISLQHRTQMIPGNINTPLGIAQWVLNELNAGTRVLIVEMDTFAIGEIARSCKVTQPDIAIITSIGDQHGVRFNSRIEVAKAIGEVFIKAKQHSTWICHEEDYQLLQQAYTKSDLLASSPNLTIVGDKNSINSFIADDALNNIFSSSNQENLALALRVAEILNIPNRFIMDTVNSLQLPDRRQKQSLLYGFEGIDDSYNISYTTAQEGVERAGELAKISNKKLLVVTAGIPELAGYDSNSNTTYGELLAKITDSVIVLETDFAPQIITGIESIIGTGYVVDYHRVANYQNAISLLLSDYSPEEFFVLIQPELTDLYY